MAAAHYYVRNNSNDENTFVGTGVGTGDLCRETVARTGTWDTNTAHSFPSVTDCMDQTGGTSPVAGDIIHVGDDHDIITATEIHLAPAGEMAAPVLIVSTSITNQDEYAPGAREEATGSSTNVTAVNYSSVSTRGVRFEAGHDFKVSVGATAFLEDCTVTLDTNGSYISITQDNGVLIATDVDFVWTAGRSAHLFQMGASAVDLTRCTFTATTGALARAYGAAANGGLTHISRECDFSNITGYFLEDTGANITQDDNIHIELYDCVMASDPPLFANEDFTSPAQYFFAVNCASASVPEKSEYQFFQKTMGGVVEDSGDDGTSGGIYRDESTAFTNGNKVSYKCVTSEHCNLGAPVIFTMRPLFADLTDSDKDEITIYIASATALTQENTWIEVSYPGDVNKHVWETVTSRPVDILGSTALTSDGDSTWQDAGVDLTTENEYKITVAMTDGDGCVPNVRVHCGVPSITFYVDTTAELS
ncbi:MAG: hypothetical protein GY814_20380 [Gammaproteobacteria bacterium]|nr:hypothetical protein [Gammaproteobacteria bacterium]